MSNLSLGIAELCESSMKNLDFCHINMLLLRQRGLKSAHMKTQDDLFIFHIAVNLFEEYHKSLALHFDPYKLIPLRKNSKYRLNKYQG